MTGERVSSGLAGLDEVLHGGFIRGLAYLVRGGPGTGKTQVGLHFLQEGVEQGEGVLFVSLESRRSLFETAFGSLGFDLASIRFVSLVERADGPEEEYSLFAPGDVEHGSQMNGLIKAIEEHKPQRLFIDGFSQIRLLSPNEFQFRRQVRSFLAMCHDRGITTLFSSEAADEGGDSDLQFMSHGIITVRSSVEFGRSVEVTKSVGSGYSQGRHTLVLDAQGASVYPRMIPGEHSLEFEAQLLPSGITELDSLLHGGVHRGSVTMISGPNGVGKTTTGLQFLVEAAQRGERAVMFSLEEEPDVLIGRAESIGQPLRRLMEEGTFQLVTIEPLLLTADEFTWLVREQVEAGACSVMLDSLAGLRMALKGEDIIERVHALTKYLQRVGVTTFILNEMEKIISTDLSVTDYGVSYLADNILLLRYMETDGEIRRSIGVLKKRMGDFEKTLREFSITSRGLSIGEPLLGMEGILSGLPRRAL